MRYYNFALDVRAACALRSEGYAVADAAVRGVAEQRGGLTEDWSP